MLIHMIEARCSIPGMLMPQRNRKSCVESMFEVKKGQILHPEEKHVGNQPKRRTVQGKQNSPRRLFGHISAPWRRRDIRLGVNLTSLPEVSKPSRTLGFCKKLTFLERIFYRQNGNNPYQSDFSHSRALLGRDFSIPLTALLSTLRSLSSLLGDFFKEFWRGILGGVRDYLGGFGGGFW